MCWITCTLVVVLARFGDRQDVPVRIAQDDTVALVFAAIAKDVDRYFPALFRAVARQTVPLDELATVVSGVGSTGCDAIRRKAQGQLRAAHVCEGRDAAELPSLRLLCVAALQDQATSRQQATGLVKSAIISYVDADDQPFAVRNEVVRSMFATYRPRMFLHSWTMEPDYEQRRDVRREINSLVGIGKKLMFGEAVYDMVRARPPGQLWTHAKMHHAHLSVAAEVIRSVLWHPCKIIPCMGEDSIFVADIVLHYGRRRDTAVFLNAPLSHYVPHKFHGEHATRRDCVDGTPWQWQFTRAQLSD